MAVFNSSLTLITTIKKISYVIGVTFYKCLKSFILFFYIILYYKKKEKKLLVIINHILKYFNT